MYFDKNIRLKKRKKSKLTEVLEETLIIIASIDFHKINPTIFVGYLSTTVLPFLTILQMIIPLLVKLAEHNQRKPRIIGGFQISAH